MFSISSSWINLQALVGYDALRGIAQARGDRVLLQRTYDREGRALLRPLLESDVTWWDRLKYFFWAKDLLLESVVQVAQEALLSPELSRCSERERIAIGRAIDVLNDKVDRYSEKGLKRITFIFDQSISGRGCVVAPSIISPIRNSGNKCYLISLLTVLASSDSFFQRLSDMPRKNELATWLFLCLQELRAFPDRVVFLRKAPFYHFLEAFSAVFPGAALICFEQQDVHECATILMNGVFQEQALFDWREISKPDDFGRREQRSLYNTMWTVWLEEGVRQVDLQSLFSLDEGRQRSLLTGRVPSFIPFHVQRNVVSVVGGLVRNVRNKTEVIPSYLLEIPHENGNTYRYVLRSIIVHQGECVDSGHYVTYIPLDHANNVPQRCAKNDDGAPVVECSWREIENNITRNGYVYFYDQEPFSKGS